MDTELALVPPRRAHLTRFHGVFAPNVYLRAQLTPSERGKRPATNAVRLEVSANDEPRSPEGKRRAMTWAQRIERVFNIDVATCIHHCGGGVRIVASSVKEWPRTANLRGPATPQPHTRPPDPSPKRRFYGPRLPERLAEKGV